MRVFTADGPIPEAFKGAAVALGVMDGVHRGHQSVLRAAGEATAARVAPLAAAVFEPHPRTHFQPDAPPFRLQTAAQRARALSACGAGAIFEIPFGPSLAALTADQFVEEVLARRLGVSHVAVGFDFRFGQGRAGDVDALARAGAVHGFSVSVTQPVLRAGEKISSTAIRARLAAGDARAAADMLTRPWAIEGVVIAGAQRGRTIGVPTANIALGAYQRPRFGVYAVRVDLGDGALRPGVANCGVKPTVGADEPLLETHVFDYEGDLYGRAIEVSFIDFIRPERAFASLDALKAQIGDDTAAARTLLAARP